MTYSEKVIDHFHGPKNVGRLDKTKHNVGTGIAGAPECGDVIRIQIEVDNATAIITDVKFKTFGCGSAIACSSLATEWIKGHTVELALQIDHMAFVNELDLPPIKIHCAVLVQDAIKAAISDYRKKQNKESLLAEENI